MRHKTQTFVAGILAIALLLVATPPLRAGSVFIPVTPGSAIGNAFTFDIASKALPGGMIQFRIVVSEKNETFVHSTTDLSTVLFTETAREIRGVRALAQEKKGRTITCVFTVPEKDLADPNLSFVFTNYAEVMENGKPVLMPAADFYFARLKDYYKARP